MLYAVYRISDGVLISETTLPVASVPEGLAVAEFDELLLPPRRMWDAATTSYVARPLNVRPQLRRDEMARRFTIAERVALKTAKRTHPNETVRSRLEILEEDIILPERFDVTDPYLIAGVTYAVDALVTLGVVTAENRDARIAALLVSGEEE